MSSFKPAHTNDKATMRSIKMSFLIKNVSRVTLFSSEKASFIAPSGPFRIKGHIVERVSYKNTVIILLQKIFDLYSFKIFEIIECMIEFS